jgi:hypothetical protein
MTNFYFYTHPSEGSKDHYRFWVVGDAGRGNNLQRIVRDAFLYVNDGKKIDAWLWLGDNAYNLGLDLEYQNNVFSNNTYEHLMKNLVVWAAPGNHDYAQNPLNAAPPWLDIFDFPANGECGGVPSFTEKFFSWNYGNVHFVQLDSYGSDRSDSGNVAQWLHADLQQNQLPWTVVYFHHPPYTKGNHDSDNLMGWDPELPQMRSNILPILEKYGVDLVLSGHSHAYERTSLIDEHYGYSYTLHDSMMIDSTGGNYPFTCAYIKDSVNGKGHKGAVYAVVGVSAAYSGVQSDWPHPVMHTTFATELGSMLLEIHDNKLSASFINAYGVKLDSFTIVKHMQQRKILTVCKDSLLCIKPTWHENSIWAPNGFIGDSLIIFPDHDSLIIANDFYNCLTDTFEIKVIPDSLCSNWIGVQESRQRDVFQIFPNPAKSGQAIFLKAENTGNSVNVHQLFLFGLEGRLLGQQRFEKSNEQQIKIDTNGLTAGTYFLMLNAKGKKTIFKIILLPE